MTNKAAELVFIPSPGTGHMGTTLDVAKLLVDRDERLSITVLVIPLPTGTIASQPLSSSSQRIRIINLPHNGSQLTGMLLSFVGETHKPQVRDAVTQLIRSESGQAPPRLAGFVVDMFCTPMIDVANEFGVPTYVLFTSGAAFLGMMLHFQSLQDDQGMDLIQFKDSDAELALPFFSNPIPAKVLPPAIFDKQAGAADLLSHPKRYREAKGIIVNTFMELEAYALNSLSGGTSPQVYPIGPILNLEEGDQCARTQQREDIIKWLDDQPPLSVVFLCFGSRGCFDADQVTEMARAIESSGYRFLWSLRRPSPSGKRALPVDYTNLELEQVLPDGFLDRTAGIGKVIGWAPQVAVLAHPSVGGFVSHCGWNSTLESLWFGVPMAAWPLYAEQQMNAFQEVVELGTAVEIKLDYRKENNIIVGAEDIERGIRGVMEDSGVRKKVKDMKDKSRRALTEGGSSYEQLGHLVEDIIHNIP